MKILLILLFSTCFCSLLTFQKVEQTPRSYSFYITDLETKKYILTLPDTQGFNFTYQEPIKMRIEWYSLDYFSHMEMIKFSIDGKASKIGDCGVYSQRDGYIYFSMPVDRKKPDGTIFY